MPGPISKLGHAFAQSLITVSYIACNCSPVMYYVFFFNVMTRNFIHAFRVEDVESMHACIYLSRFQIVSF